jgi:large subunit ribosomal protein L9
MAKAILLQPVETLGQRGEVIEVSPGYLRNYLVPRKLAQTATAGALAEARRRQVAEEQAAQQRLGRARENAAILNRTVLTIPQPAGEDGRLFGSVTSQDISDAIKQARNIKVDRRKIGLDQPIKSTGTHMVTVEVQDGVTAEIKTIVTPQ